MPRGDEHWQIGAYSPRSGKERTMEEKKIEKAEAEAPEAPEALDTKQLDQVAGGNIPPMFFPFG